MDCLYYTIYLRPGRADEIMTLKTKISEIIEEEVSSYYTERVEIEEATAQLLALFEKEKVKTRQQLMNEISCYNVAFCNKCKCIFKAEHKNCPKRTKLAKTMEGKHD